MYAASKMDPICTDLQNVSEFVGTAASGLDQHALCSAAWHPVQALGSDELHSLLQLAGLKLDKVHPACSIAHQSCLLGRRLPDGHAELQMW